MYPATVSGSFTRTTFRARSWPFWYTARSEVKSVALAVSSPAPRSRSSSRRAGSALPISWTSDQSPCEDKAVPTPNRLVTAAATRKRMRLVWVERRHLRVLVAVAVEISGPSSVVASRTRK
jgi:hypothetical protein